MITLTSKQSSQIVVPLTAGVTTELQSKPNQLIIESGVAIVNFSGSHSNDWTRDTLSFPVGKALPQADYISGIVTGSPASFWINSPPIAMQVQNTSAEIAVNVTVQASDSSGPVSGSGFGNIVVPAVSAVSGKIQSMGCAVDSATVAYSAQAGQPVATFALAVFGTSSFIARIAYTAHIVSGTPGITVGNGGGEVKR